MKYLYLFALAVVVWFSSTGINREYRYAQDIQAFGCGIKFKYSNVDVSWNPIEAIVFGNFYVDYTRDK